MATVTSFSMMHFIEKDILPVWSFRLLFVFSAINLYIGFKARRTLSETAEFFISFPSFESNKLKAVIDQAACEIKNSVKSLCKVFFIFGFGTHITYSLILYAPFHLLNVN